MFFHVGFLIGDLFGVFLFFLLPVLIGVSGLQAALLLGSGYKRSKKKIQETHCHVVLQVLRLLANLPSLHLSGSFDFFIYCTQEF